MQREDELTTGQAQQLPEMDRERAKQRARDAVGKFRSGLGDLGLEHDRYLEEDFGADSRG